MFYGLNKKLVMKFQQILILGCFLFIFGCGSSASKKASSSENAELIEMSGLNFWENYTISNSKFKTETRVRIENDQRIMITNALPNHATGKFPNSGNPNVIKAQNKIYSFPISPKFSGESKWAREPGIALNGVKFEPETAEKFVCDNGDVYRIEAFQDLVDLGLDFNNAHVQPSGAYHYHGVPTEFVKMLDTKEDAVLVGFALDGFPIYYSKSGAYKPSYKLTEELRTGDICVYDNPKHGMTKDLKNTTPDGTFVSDWVYVQGFGQLDECNGIELNGEYVYFVTIEYPYMSRCLKGEFEEKKRRRPQSGEHSHNLGNRHSH